MNKVKVLFVAANPVGTKPLQLDEEIRQITTKIRSAEYRDSLELVSRWALRPDDLLQALLEVRPQIVHFSGHGTQDRPISSPTPSPLPSGRDLIPPDSGQAGQLIFMGDRGQPQPVSQEALVHLFRILSDNVRVVVLNACYSLPLAEALAETIDCSIGINQPIGDEAAIVFAASFYRTLGFGRSVKEAFEVGKAALLLESIPEDETPELLTRAGVDASAIIFVQPPAAVAGKPAPSKPGDPVSMPKRLALVRDLSRLAPPDWEMLVTAIEGAAARVSRHGTVPEQAAELIRWAESPTGPGLAAVEEAFKILNPLTGPPPSGGTTTVGQAFWNVPHPRNPSFTGREDVIAGLRAVKPGSTSEPIGQPGLVPQGVALGGGISGQNDGYQIVLLIHGIRTEADWGPMVRSRLEVPGQIEVIPIRYGYFDAFRFWFPFWTRNKPIERVYEQIRVALQKYRRSHPDAKLSIIAHSFGTYIIGEILKKGFDLQIERLLLCGSVLPQGFLWHQYQGRFDDDKVVNECGKADIWPVLAQSASWGYGASGTHGFGAVLVKDRFHAGGHGQYFDPGFVEKYWEPFIRRGVYQGTEFERTMPPTPWWISVLGILPFKWLLALVLTALLVYFPYYVIKSYVRGHAPEVIKAENLPTWTNNYSILSSSFPKKLHV